MTRKLNIKATIAGVAATLALVVGLFAAPDAMAGDRGKRWNDGRGHYVERQVNRNRAHRRVERYHAYHYHGRRHVHRPAPRRHIHRQVPKRPYRSYVKHRDFPVGAVILGIGAGIITHAIISNHYHD
ncbi:MAG: hypothetical protein OEO83_00330 [Alphaproteobacteria bacterium]|nr:hypothetical protein [Alphaproteobacteria bacterium]